MLLDVGNSQRPRLLFILGIAFLFLAGAMMTHALQTPSQTQQSARSESSQIPTPPSGQSATPVPTGPQSSAQASQNGLSVVVLDPAHGGTDLGARGTGGIQESEIVMEFTAEVRKALEQQGFQVVQTRQANDNRSEEHTSELQSPDHLVCRLLLVKKNVYRWRLLLIGRVCLSRALSSA